MLAVHLYQHEGSPGAESECEYKHLEDHLKWNDAYVYRVVRYAKREDYISEKNGSLVLTLAGRELAKKAIVE